MLIIIILLFAAQWLPACCKMSCGATASGTVQAYPWNVVPEFHCKEDLKGGGAQRLLMALRSLPNKDSNDSDNAPSPTSSVTERLSIGAHVKYYCSCYQSFMMVPRSSRIVGGVTKCSQGTLDKATACAMSLGYGQAGSPRGCQGVTLGIPQCAQASFVCGHAGGDRSSLPGRQEPAPHGWV